MYPITSIAELTFLSLVPPVEALMAAIAAIARTLGLGVRGRLEILRRMEKLSARRIEGRKILIECHQGRGFTDSMQKPKADFGMHRALRMVNFTGRRCTSK